MSSSSLSLSSTTLVVVFIIVTDFVRDIVLDALVAMAEMVISGVVWNPEMG